LKLESLTDMADKLKSKEKISLAFFADQVANDRMLIGRFKGKGKR